MKKNALYIIIMIAVICYFGCDTEGEMYEYRVDLRLNELMARNDSTVFDEAGEADDWIEIYNAVGNGGDVIGYYLTDDSDEPRKWQIPDTSVSEYGFLFFWADDDCDQGNTHICFKLSGGGEFLGLYKDTDSGLVVIDSLSFPEQFTDISYGRLKDGCNGWDYVENASPGWSND